MTSWNSVAARAHPAVRADTQLDRIQEVLSGSNLASFAALRQEANPEYFADGLIEMGRRLEVEAPSAASEIYQFLQKPGGAATMAQHRRADERLAALAGRGPFAGRAENTVLHLLREAADPAALAAFAVAAPAFRYGRLFASARLGEGALGKEAIAVGAGLVSETFAFTVAGKTLSRFLGRPVDGSLAGLQREGLSNFLLLASLKLAHALPLPSHAGKAFAGIALGHGAQIQAGLRPGSDLATWLQDSFAAFLQAQIGGELGRRFFGPGFAAVPEPWVRRNAPPSSGLTGDWAWAGAAAGLPRAPSADPFRPAPLLASALGNKPGGGKKSAAAPAGSTVESLKAIASRAQKMEPQDAVKFLTRLALQLKEAGLPETAGPLLFLAKENIARVESIYHTVHSWAELAACQSKMGHWEAAQNSFSMARHAARDEEPNQQISLLVTLAARQHEHKDPTAPATLLIAEEALGGLEESDLPGYREFLAQRLVRLGELNWARRTIDRNPWSGRTMALSELGKAWAFKYASAQKPEYLTIAHAYFHEARGALDASLKSGVDVEGRYSDLILRAWEAGAPFRYEALEWLEEFRKLVFAASRNPDSLMSPAKILVQLLAKTEQFAPARRLLDDIPWTSPEHRSEAVKNIAWEFAETGRFLEFERLLAEEALLPAHRFQLLLHAAELLEKAGLHRDPERRKMLKLATKLIRENEFYNHHPTRAQSMIRLAKALEGVPEMKAAFREILAAVPDALRRESISWEHHVASLGDYDLLRFQSAVLPRLKDSLPLQFSRLMKAAQAGNFSRMRSLAVTLGFRPDGWEYVSEDLGQFPRKTQAWVKTWLYYGASLLPQSRDSREQIAQVMGDLIRANFHSNGPDLFKRQTALMQAMQRIAPNSLQQILVPAIRDRIQPQRKDPGHRDKIWPETISIDPADRLLLISLLWLARNGSSTNQIFVAELMKVPAFPPSWTGQIEQALLRGRFVAASSAPTVWN